MTWKNAKTHPPDPKLEKIVVWAKCNAPHILYWNEDYDRWSHVEHCYKFDQHADHYINSIDIEFDWWDFAPEKPIEA